jgi:hypothetical protein
MADDTEQGGGVVYRLGHVLYWVCVGVWYRPLFGHQRMARLCRGSSWSNRLSVSTKINSTLEYTGRLDQTVRVPGEACT